MRHHQITLMLTCTLAALATGVQAEDHTFPSFTDLRIEGTVLPDTLEVDGTASGPLGSVSRSEDAEFEDAWRIGIIGVTARTNDSGIISFGSGGGLQYSRWHDGGDVDETVEAVTATLRLGLIIRPTPFFHLEAMPYGAIGGARGEIEDEESDIELYWEFGGIAGAFLTFGSLQIGAHAGYLWGGTELEYDSDANFPDPVEDVTLDLRAEGVFFGASIGGRF
jgi:hypothetical protein